jgi:hypothetical protein
MIRNMNKNKLSNRTGKSMLMFSGFSSHNDVQNPKRTLQSNHHSPVIRVCNDCCQTDRVMLHQIVGLVAFGGAVKGVLAAIAVVSSKPFTARKVASFGFGGPRDGHLVPFPAHSTNLSLEKSVE